MAQKLTASLPEGMDLDASYTIQWAALDPATGDPVDGVIVGQAAMLVTQVTPGTAEDLQAGPFMLVPGPEA
jgi:hypothetical protein